MAQETVAADPLIARRGLTRAQYDALVDAGLLEGEHVELLEGVLAEMVPQGEDHVWLLTDLTHHLVPRLPEPYRLQVQMPLAVSDTSEPEPDLAVVPRAGRRRVGTAALVVEVAVTSQRTDLTHKPRLYGAGGVEQYWVLDVPAGQVVRFSGPNARGYTTQQRLPWGAELSVLGISVNLAVLCPLTS